MSALEKELKFYESKKAQWMKLHPGKFTLIKGEELLGVFDTADAAVTEGAKRFGSDPFLVRQINASEENVYIPSLALGLLYANLA